MSYILSNPTPLALKWLDEAINYLHGAADYVYQGHFFNDNTIICSHPKKNPVGITPSFFLGSDDAFTAGYENSKFIMYPVIGEQSKLLRDYFEREDKDPTLRSFLHEKSFEKVFDKDWFSKNFPEDHSLYPEPLFRILYHVYTNEYHNSEGDLDYTSKESEEELIKMLFNFLPVENLKINQLFYNQTRRWNEPEDQINRYEFTGRLTCLCLFNGRTEFNMEYFQESFTDMLVSSYKTMARIAEYLKEYIEQNNLTVNIIEVMEMLTNQSPFATISYPDYSKFVIGVGFCQSLKDYLFKIWDNQLADYAMNKLIDKVLALNEGDYHDFMKMYDDYLTQLKETNAYDPDSLVANVVRPRPGVGALIRELYDTEVPPIHTELTHSFKRTYVNEDKFMYQLLTKRSMPVGVLDTLTHKTEQSKMNNVNETNQMAKDLDGDTLTIFDNETTEGDKPVNREPVSTNIGVPDVWEFKKTVTIASPTSDAYDKVKHRVAIFPVKFSFHEDLEEEEVINHIKGIFNDLAEFINDRHDGLTSFSVSTDTDLKGKSLMLYFTLSHRKFKPSFDSEFENTSYKATLKHYTNDISKILVNLIEKINEHRVLKVFQFITHDLADRKVFKMVSQIQSKAEATVHRQAFQLYANNFLQFNRRNTESYGLPKSWVDYSSQIATKLVLATSNTEETAELLKEYIEKRKSHPIYQILPRHNYVHPNDENKTMMELVEMINQEREKMKNNFSVAWLGGRVRPFPLTNYKWQDAGTFKEVMETEVYKTDEAFKAYIDDLKEKSSKPE